MRIIAAAVAALLLAGCAASAPPRPSPPPSAVSPAPQVTVSDAVACRAFREATTTGVPPSAAGENTMTWLQQQASSAPPRLQAAISRFAAAWTDPADTAAISRAQHAVTRICRT
jgi:hypothetical protein